MNGDEKGAQFAAQNKERTKNLYGYEGKIIDGDIFSDDEVLDPDKLADKKADYFKQVVDNLRGGKEGYKWICQTKHDGYNRRIEECGNLLSRVDFNKPDYIFDENFTKAIVLANHLNDVWQEIQESEKESVHRCRDPEQ
ncbi:MAG: hypothetical protein K6E84_04410 [Lachnospiraceae bacterium]|nr:hypothetical protein [Lachnospiraceae bacterium]